MINKEIVGNFSRLIGYIDIVVNLVGFDDIKDDYERVRKLLLNWVKDYYKNNNFDNVTYEESLDIHNKLQDVRDVKIYDKNLGMEAMITDQILIIYEEIVKSVNEERARVV